MKKIEFNSQICTSVEESKRLLELGLKKETADMVHYFSQSLAERWVIVPLDNGEVAKNNDFEIPAWSLHRIVEIMFKGDIEGFVGYNIHANNVNIMYKYAISNIEALIKMGTFNKDYLEERK